MITYLFAVLGIIFGVVIGRYNTVLIPNVFCDQDCTISKSGNTVTIECNNGDDANEVFDYLTELK